MRRVVFAVFMILAFGGFGTAAAVYAEAAPVSVKGEIVDLHCFLTMGAKGPSHKQCGVDCLKKGIPAGIVEEGTGKIYTLLPSQDKGSVADAVSDKMGETVTVTGTSYSSGGSQFLTVDSVS